MKKKVNGSSTVGPAARRKQVVADFKKYFQTEPVTNLSTREKLIGNILYYSADEYENRESVIDLAMESEEQLIDRLINILEYYYDEYQELS